MIRVLFQYIYNDYYSANEYPTLYWSFRDTRYHIGYSIINFNVILYITIYCDSENQWGEPERALGSTAISGVQTAVSIWA